MTRTITVYLGERSFDEFVEPFDDQPAFGVEYSSRSTGSSVGWEIGFQTSQQDGVVFAPGFGAFDVETTFTELYGGIRKTFNPESNFRPYLGGGLSLLTFDFSVSSVGSADDDVLGFYLHGGVAYSFTQSFALGLDYRLWVGDDAEIAGVEVDVDYGQLAFTLGFSF